jgi:hypothetical protein
MVIKIWERRSQQDEEKEKEKEKLAKRRTGVTLTEIVEEEVALAHRCF